MNEWYATLVADRDGLSIFYHELNKKTKKLEGDYLGRIVFRSNKTFNTYREAFNFASTYQHDKTNKEYWVEYDFS